MIREIWSDIFSPYLSFGSRCLAVLVALLMLAGVGLLGLVGLLSFLFIDSVGITPTKMAITTVEVKKLVPARNIIIPSGKIMVLHHRKESYRLYFKIDGEEISSLVKKNFFDDINVGDRIEVDYGFGRWTHSYQPTEIRLVGR